MCSDSDASPDKYLVTESKKMSVSPGKVPLRDASMIRILMSSISTTLQSNAEMIFQFIISAASSCDFDKLGRYRRCVELWYKINGVIRHGLTSLYTHREISLLFVSLIRDSESLLSISYGISCGFCDEKVFSRLAKNIFRGVVADLVGVLRNSNAYSTPLRRSSSKIRPSPMSAGSDFSLPKSSSTAERVSFLDFKKCFHFANSYFVSKDESFYGQDLHLEDGQIINPLKSTACSYFSFLRMCLSFVIEAVEPTITSKIYLRNIFEDGTTENNDGLSLLLGGKLLHEILALGM